MLYALADGRRSRARPGLAGVCPCCGTPVRPKCGEVVPWHWSHASLRDCDPWHEPVSPWHLAWQARAPESWREVVVGPHRADLLTPSGVVVELQHSPIPAASIREREDFYVNMIWLFDFTGLRRLFSFRPAGESTRFAWRRPRPSLYAARRPLFFDLGRRVLFVRSLRGDRRSASGVGVLTDPDAFAAAFFR